MLTPGQHPDPDLVIYGGSFDPPHLGHQFCISTCLEFFKRTKIMVVPAKSPVSAAKSLKPATASFSERLEMCRIAFEDELEPRVLVSSVEAEIEAPNYTLKTLRFLKRKQPNVSLCFLMGEDQWDNFSKWNEPLEILQLASIFVVRRESDKVGLNEKLLSVCKSLGVEGLCQEKENTLAIPAFKTFIYYQDVKPILLASSELRSSIADHGKLGRDVVSDEIKSYIFSRGLYQ